MDNLRRRRFLEVSALGLEGLALTLMGCRPNSTPVPVSPRETGEPKFQFRNHATVEFDRITQLLTLRPTADGQTYVAECQIPEVAPADQKQIFPGNGPGFDFSLKPGKEPFDWNQIQFQTITVGPRSYPILTSKHLDSESIEFLHRWYNEPNFLEKRISELGLELPSDEPKKVLLVHYKSTRNSYYRQTQGGCEYFFENKATYDPADLFNQFRLFLYQYTKGAVNYWPVDLKTIDEVNFPLTSDPKLTRDYLIEVYNKAMNYHTLSELARSYHVDTVFTFGGPNTGMNEYEEWTNELGSKVDIFGFNYERTYDQAIHSWLHYLESKIKSSHMGKLFSHYVGRDQELNSLRLANIRYDNETVKALSDRVFAAPGIGTPHLPPNALYEYQHESPIRVRLPGKHTLSDSSLWAIDASPIRGNAENRYNAWWLNQLPPSFLSVLG